jgi:pSer/pThr/pTyr-binding forkhead associated (FHA) protein
VFAGGACAAALQVLTLLGRLPCNDVVADHPSMSRQHAAIFFRQQQQQLQAGSVEAVVWDLGSAHGTFVQGNRISKVRPGQHAHILDNYAR